MKKWFLLIGFFMVVLTGISQLTYEDRIEIQLKDGYSREEIKIFGEEGFILSSKKNDSEDDLTEWKFEKFNTYLQSEREVTVKMDEDLDPRLNYTSAKIDHSIYSDRHGNFALISVEAESMEITKVHGKLPKKFDFDEMVVLGDFAFVSGVIKNDPVVFAINWKSGVFKMLPVTLAHIKPKKCEISKLQVMEKSNEIFIYINGNVDKKHTESYAFRFNEKAEYLNKINLTPQNNNLLIELSASQIDENKYVFTGTYAVDHYHTSEGVFFCLVENDQVNFIKFHEYAKMVNFLKYLPEKKQEKLEKKKAKMEKKGKVFTFNYRLLTHDVIADQDGYLLLGEGFYPTYITHSYTTTTFINGSPVTSIQTYTEFDGYQYTHAMLCKFDKEGNMLWDQIFEMWGTYKPFYLKKFISITAHDQNMIKMVYTSYNKVHTKALDHDGNILSDTQTEEIETNQSGDETKYSFSDIIFWYDNYFLAYGTQKIKNETGNIKFKQTRSVYFINKIKFE